MATVDTLFAEWLQADGLWLVSEDAASIARWGDTAITSERMTSIALKADADAEADRQLIFLRGPLVIDEHLLKGEWSAYRGQVITLTCARLGYDAGVAVYVLGAQDDRSTGLSTVTVLRRL